MKLILTCPQAEYRGNQIWCKKAGSWCGHAYFKRCKGWWVLTPQAASCPLRKETKNNDQR